MYHKRLVKEVDNLLDNMKKLAASAYYDHNKEDIHQFRVHYKKLRALLRMAHGGRYKTDMPVSMKKLYAAAGALRNLQIHNNTVAAYFGTYGTLPTHYMEVVANAIQTAGNEYNREYKRNSFSRSRHIITHHLPHHLRRSRLKKWMDDTDKPIQGLLQNATTDEQLHELRKYIKDRIYTDEYAPVHRELKAMAQALGDYLDASILLQMTTDLSHDIPKDELPLLKSAKHRWLADKQDKKAFLMEAINKMV